MHFENYIFVSLSLSFSVCVPVVVAFHIAWSDMGLVPDLSSLSVCVCPLRRGQIRPGIAATKAPCLVLFNSSKLAPRARHFTHSRTHTLRQCHAFNCLDNHSVN